MKRFLMTTALVALMPVAVLAESHAAADADATVKMQQTDQSAGADATTPMVDGTETAEGTADGMKTDEQTAEGTDPMMPKAGETDSTAMTAEQLPEGQTMQTADMVGKDLGITGQASANSIIGSPVYVIRGDNVGEWDKTATFDAVGEGWERAGSVQDIVLGANGQVSGIVAEVGGFLGIGDKYVLLELGEAKLVPLEDGGFDVVTHYSNDQLTDMQAFEAAALQ